MHPKKNLNSLTTLFREALDSSNVLPGIASLACSATVLNGIGIGVPVNGEIDQSSRSRIPSRWDGAGAVLIEAPLSGVGRTVQPSGLCVVSNYPKQP